MSFTDTGALRVKTAVGVGGLLGLALTRGVNIIMNKVLCQEKNGTEARAKGVDSQ